MTRYEVERHGKNVRVDISFRGLDTLHRAVREDYPGAVCCIDMRRRADKSGLDAVLTKDEAEQIITALQYFIKVGEEEDVAAI